MVQEVEEEGVTVTSGENKKAECGRCTSRLDGPEEGASVGEAGGDEAGEDRGESEEERRGRREARLGVERDE